MTDFTGNNKKNKHETIDQVIDDAADGAIPECEVLTYDELLELAGEMHWESSPHDVQTLLEMALHLSALERDGLTRKIKEKTKVTLGAQRDCLRSIDPSMDMEAPDHLELAHEIIERFGKDNLIANSAYLYKWQPDNGLWQKLQERHIRQEIQQIIQAKNVYVTHSLTKSVAEIISDQSYRSSHRWNINPDIINFTNGELHWIDGQWQLKAHCREHYCTTQIPHSYNSNALCQRFEQFLDEVFRDDGDKGEKRELLLQMLGYTLASHARYEAFIILIGSGANGKSVVMELLRHLLGNQNVCGVQPSNFSHRFQRGHLDGKLANLVTEIAEGGEIDDAGIKAITSGELMTAEHKNKPPFDFMPFCTCWFGTNHLPHSSDYSDALQRRAKIVSFNRVFKAGIDQDPSLKRKLCDEAEGIIALCLAAYGRVIKAGCFIEPHSSLEYKRQWQLQNDQVRQFIDERCECAADNQIDSKMLYDTYTRWADDEGVTRKLKHKTFSNRLRQFGCTPDKGTAGRRIITGISLVGIENCYAASGASGASSRHWAKAL
jgi:putative DNA primase/helicase